MKSRESLRKTLKNCSGKPKNIKISPNIKLESRKDRLQKIRLSLDKRLFKVITLTFRNNWLATKWFTIF